MSTEERTPLSAEQLDDLLKNLEPGSDIAESIVRAQRGEGKLYWLTEKSISPSLHAFRILAQLSSKGASFSQLVAQAKQLATPGDNAPPSTFLLDLLMKPDEAKDAAANLEDYYAVWVAKHGARRASRIFRFQASRILVGYWWGRIMTQVERVVKTVSVFVRPGGN